MKKLLFFAGSLLLMTTASAQAQIAQGGVYKLDQAVIASGGSSSGSVAGGTYTLDGVIGEPVAGTTSSLNNYSVKGGFLSSPALAPTAASVSISGRVVNLNGDGLLNARVTLTDAGGNARTILTKKFGAFRFDDVAAGAFYVITISSRRYTFESQAVSITTNVTDLIFTAQGATILSNTAP